MQSVGKWESVGGDIKFLRLKQRNIGGLVTDGSVRDTDEIINYGKENTVAKLLDMSCDFCKISSDSFYGIFCLKKI